jgi:uncharacterized protein (TIRG00374 family)
VGRELDLPSAPPADEMPDELHPRHIAVRVVEIAAIIAVCAIAITALPGLGDVRSRLEGADPFWLALLVLAELASCGGYVLVFRATFCPRMPWGLSYDISMAELAANSLLPTGGAGGLALGVWALHQAGMASAHIARRTVAFFLLTSAANFAAVVVVGVGMFAGILSSDVSAALTLGPALVAASVVTFAWISPGLLRAVGEPPAPVENEGWAVRAGRIVREAIKATADGVDLTKSLLQARSFGVIVGSFSYMAFDIAALACGFAAVGPVPAFGPLVMAYLLGQLGNLIPLPGGIGGTEAGLVGAFALYHVNVSLALAAVLIYRLFQLVVPALLGLPAFILLRRKLAQGQYRAELCGSLGVDPIELPEVQLTPH